MPPLGARNEAGARSAGQLPALEQPPCAERIGSEGCRVAANPAVHLLDVERIRKAHGPFEPVDRERQTGAMRPMLRGVGYTFHAAGHFGQEHVYSDVAQAGFLSVQPEMVRRVEEMRRRSGVMESGDRQIGVAIAVALGLAN